MWVVYYLFSPSLQSYYIGKTNNIERREREHNLGQETYTRRGIPWKLIGYIPCKDSKDAYQLETKLKKSKNKQYTQWYIQKHGIWNNEPADMTD